ncbi:radial spoke head 14 homolog [Anthonomus grandis grandis]|uniref:radial spoke head 14 homolog n=1 Tax=Anthonomus grandis grandis TaxID=2921223 RepID=UPI00216656E8|nr:radial spoke head 14 homolog [Anthonomus grandis grandis]
MYSCHKNSYLQGNYPEIKAGLINRCVHKAWGEISHIDEHDLNPPLKRLTSEQPQLLVNNVDVTRRPEGFGRWALPKLRRELHHKDINVVIAALTSISDMVHNPERCFEGIRLKVIDRLADLLVHEMPAIRERTAYTLKVFAGVALGRQAIVDNQTLLINLLDKVEDDVAEVRIQVAACLEMISRFWLTADVLVDSGFIQVLLTNLNDSPEIVATHLDTLDNMLYCNGRKIAIDEDAFGILVKLFETTDTAVLTRACRVLVRLCELKEGRKLARHFQILQVLNKLLHNEIEEVYEAAAEAIMFCTIKSAEKISASKLTDMPKRLVELSINRTTRRTQLFTIKALTSICEHPLVRQEVREKYYNAVKSIQVRDDIPEIKDCKNILMTLLAWVPQSKD